MPLHNIVIIQSHIFIEIIIKKNNMLSIHKTLNSLQICIAYTLDSGIW